MPDIKDTVEYGKAYKSHDAAILQAMLVLVKNSKNQPYLASYDGIWGKQSRDAIEAFQLDHFKGSGTGPGMLPGTPGQVKKGDATIKALNALLPNDRKDLHVLENSKVVYLAGAAADATASKKSISTEADFNVTFRPKAAEVVSEMYDRFKMVITTTNSGRRRSFAQQYALRNNLTKAKKFVTGAGAGESNHQYGQAVDLGFKGLQWLRGNGDIKTDTWWLHHLATEKKEAQALVFWEALRKVGTKTVGLHITSAGDRPHLQLSKEPVHMRTRLAAHLTAVAKTQNVLPKAIWGTSNLRSGRFRTYTTDFGLGGNAYNVGSANDIWEGNAKVSKAELAGALTAAARKANPKAPAVLPAKITPKQLQESKTTLQTIFKLADTQWKSWTAK